MATRAYQKFVISKVMKALIETKESMIVAMPPGTGKSFVNALIINEILNTWPQFPARFACVTHVKELVAQNSSKLPIIMPNLSFGIYCAGLDKKDAHYQVTVGSIASIHRAVEKLGRIDILIIDECHLVSDKSSSMYFKFITALKKKNPKLRIIGLTATPYRQDMGILTNGKIFDSIVCDLTTLEWFNWFFETGYLSPVVPYKTKTTLSDEGIRTVAGDYSIHDMDEKHNLDSINHEVCEEIVQAMNEYGREKALVFGISIDHAVRLTSIFRSLGMRTACVHSDMEDAERDKYLIDYANGEYDIMVNNAILTTGYDCPSIDLIAVVRLIKSSALWVQILGRGIRPVYAEGFDLSTEQGRLDALKAGGKEACMVLDFGANTKRLGPINDVLIPKDKTKGKGEAPTRLCDCGVYIHASLRVCHHCGKKFEHDPESNLEGKASQEELIAKKRKEKVSIDIPKPDPIKIWVDIDHVSYSVLKSRTPAKPDKLKVTYHAGLVTYHTYLCFENKAGSFPWQLARRYWRKHVVGTPFASLEPPVTVNEANSRVDQLRSATSIEVIINSKFKEVTDYKFES